MAAALDYSDIEAKMSAALAADASLDALVTTFGAGLKARIDLTRAATYGYGTDALPICVAFVRDPIGDSVRSEYDTVGEILNRVPCAVMSIARNSVADTAKAAAVVMREHAERIVKKQVSAANKWGGAGKTLLETVASGLSLIQDGEQFVALGEVTFEMLVFTDIERT